MPDAVSLLWRFFSFDWVPVVGLAMLGVIYVAVSTRVPRSGPQRGLATGRRPGWIARRRARGGIGHRRGRVGVGYVSATRTMALSARELAGHGVCFGGPGSGKTTFLQLLIEASAGNVPVVVVDPKGSPALEETVRAHGGKVWTLDGKLPVDLLDPRPWQVPDLLLEAEDYSADARAYRDAAHQRALWAAWSLALDGRPMDLAELRRRLDRDVLARILELHRDRDPLIGDWLHRLEHQHGGIEDSGARGLDRALGTLLDGVALRGSLQTCPEALRLEDVLATRGLVLFSLDAAEYPHATRKVASWVLLGMGRLARQLPVPTDGGPTALLLVDEVGALGHQARHLRGLVGRARESGLAVVLASQGPSDLEAVDRALLPQVLQDTAWQLAFRQGSPQDAERMQAVFGQAYVIDESWTNDGRVTKRQVERPRVSIDEWMNGLQPGDAWLRVAPVDRGWRQARVRVALPKPSTTSTERAIVPARVRIQGSDTASDTNAHTTRRQYPSGVSETQPGAPRVWALPPVPPDCPAELLGKVGADIIAKVVRRWPKHRHELGPCLVWRDGEPTIQAAGGLYGRIYDPALKRTDYAHRVVWRRVYGPIPDHWTVDHVCRVTLCQRPDHLELVTKGENTRRRHQRARTTAETTNKPAAAQRFAVALFEGVDQPAVQPRTVSLGELAKLLTRFGVLADKRRGRCWSPTEYAVGHLADGASTRSNAGVASVTCLVFDCDRVPPDPERLNGVCWIGHTTWSHTPETPKWRVVIPLARPVAAKRWRDVWLRARAALCPEADPSCKDPSRQYYLPSHPTGVLGDTVYHAGQLLEVSTLPELLRAERPPKARRVKVSGDRRRGEAYMDGVIRNLEIATRPGRNNALNGAAWTLGRWVAADALKQSEVEEALYAAAVANGLVADDGERQCWATIRSGLGAGLQEAVDLIRS